MSDEFKAGKPEVIDQVDVDFGRDDVPVKSKGGRPPGSFGHKRAAQEQMKAHWELVSVNMFKAACNQLAFAIDSGESWAVKEMMARGVPVYKAADEGATNQVPAISINIGNLDKPPKIVSEQ